MRYSEISEYKNCPRKYKYRYRDKLECFGNYDSNNALKLGTAIHYACETGSVEKMLELYFNSYLVIDEYQINEAIKLSAIAPKVLKIINSINKPLEHEFRFEIQIPSGTYHGTADLVATNEDGSVDIYDYKYSNNVQTYLDSFQLDLYAYFFDKIGRKVKNLYYIFIPKIFIRQKQTETLEEFRQRMLDELRDKQPQLVRKPYNPQKVKEAQSYATKMLNDTEFKPNPNRLCDWCDYKAYCQENDDTNLTLRKDD